MTTYYMRADGTAANKAAATGPGSSQSACMSIATHNGESFSPGDVILLCDDGGIFTDQLEIPSAGSSGNPITYRPEPGDSPLIDVGVGATGAFRALVGDDFITVEDIEFAGGTDACVVGNGHDITFDGLVVHDGGQDNIRCSQSASNCYNLIIRNCICYDAVTFAGIYVGNGGSPGGPDNVLIENNTCHNNGNSTNSHHGIYVGDVSNTTIKRNICYSNAAGGIKYNGACSDLVIEENYCYSNYTGIIVFGSGGMVRNNLVTLNTRGMDFNNGTSDSFVYHNTLVDQLLYGWWFQDDNTPSGLVLKNNVIYQDFVGRGENIHPIRMSGDGTGAAGANTFDYNLYYYPGALSNRIMNMQTGANKTLAEWQAVTGSPDANSLNVDPQFLTNFTDMHLESDSPCIGAAVGVSVMLDKDGIPRNRSFANDLGCYESLKGGPRGI